MALGEGSGEYGVSCLSTRALFGWSLYLLIPVQTQLGFHGRKLGVSPMHQYSESVLLPLSSKRWEGGVGWGGRMGGGRVGGQGGVGWGRVG